ncbi:hypothetical protein BH11ACT3_BH11ACT3_17330 [soil metagenome]
MNGSSLGAVGLLALGIGALVVLVLLFRAMPRLAFVIWAVVLFFVPVWIGATAGFFWAAITVVTLVVIVASLGRVRWGAPDIVMLLFAAVCVLMFVLKQASTSATVIALLEWVVPYIWGRIVLSRVTADFMYRVVAALAAAVAVLALIEFATGRNAFVDLPALGPSYTVWSPLQYRGGLLRAEGAFGHSIALGSSLAIAAAFLLASSLRTVVKLCALALIIAAIVVTFSRIALVGVVITVALSVVVGARLTRVARIAIVVVAAAAAVFLVPFISGVFLDAANEASGSAAYRGDLFQLVPQLAWFGSSADFSVITTDGSYLGAFADSVDNALLLVALRFGIFPVLLIILLLAMAIVSVLTPGRANVGSIAIVAQIPAMFSVAFITQYGMFVWFVGGLAVSLWYVDGRRRRDGVDGFAVADRLHDPVPGNHIATSTTSARP